MQDVDGLIAQCFELNPRARKRLREVAWEEIWAAGGDNVPDFSTLPKEIWGMIAARCEVSRATLTALMSLNKERISAVAWVNFRFPASWNYISFAERFIYKQNFRTRPGFVDDFWKIFGFGRSSGVFKAVEPYASVCVANVIWSCMKRTLDAYSRIHNALRAFLNPSAILIGISKLLSLYVPLHDHCKTFCIMFEHLGCTVFDWPEDVSGCNSRQPKDLNAVVPPPELTMIKAPLTNVDVALGYYNVYRRQAFKDYGVRLPIIEVEDD
jgi:hypothetical protein